MTAIDPGSFDYFEGDAVVGEYTFSIPDRGETECRHILQWVHRAGTNVLCRQPEAFIRIEKHRRVSKEERQKIEAKVAADLGLPYLSALSSELRTSVCQTITLEAEDIEEQNFRFQGPDCFDLKVAVYQLQSVVELSCEWTPRFRKRRYWEQRIRFAHQQFEQVAEERSSHLDCGCNPDAPQATDTLDVRAQGLRLREPYLVHGRTLVLFTMGVAVVNGRVVTFDPSQERGPWPDPQAARPDWTLSPEEVATELLEPLTRSPLSLPGSVLPDYLRFVTDIGGGQSIDVRFKEREGVFDLVT